MTFDATSPQFRHDPYPTYANLRKNEPVPFITASSMGEMAAFLVTRYDDVVTVLKDPRFSNDMRKIGERMGRWGTCPTGPVQGLRSELEELH